MAGPFDNIFASVTQVINPAQTTTSNQQNIFGPFGSVLSSVAGMLGATKQETRKSSDLDGNGYLTAKEIEKIAWNEGTVSLIDWETKSKGYDRITQNWALPKSAYGALAKAGDNDASSITRKDVKAYIEKNGETIPGTNEKGIPVSKIEMANTAERLPLGLGNILTGIFS